jgi:hypothetical protein
LAEFGRHRHKQHLPKTTKVLISNRSSLRTGSTAQQKKTRSLVQLAIF